MGGILKKRRKIRLHKKFFKRNGGLLLQQQMFAKEDSLQNTKIFTSKELDKATDYFNKNRVVGQGTVYKGMLDDGRIVAVKRSTGMVAENVEKFINEVVILSRINHRNVVKLLGCCLETEVPLLVYEFIPNGTIFQYLHDQSEEFKMSWETRLRIAKESAEALSYLHSSASIPIFIIETSREKPVSFERGDNRRGLASRFIDSMEENRVLDIVDDRVMEQARPEELMMVAKLAYQCLSLSRRKRPTMKDVSLELEQILSMQKDLISSSRDSTYFQQLQLLILQVLFPEK
ncbi:hypothetical protein V6N11_054844 [Hibiscus sabdariffa]